MHRAPAKPGTPRRTRSGTAPGKLGCPATRGQPREPRGFLRTQHRGRRMLALSCGFCTEMYPRRLPARGPGRIGVLVGIGRRRAGGRVLGRADRGRARGQRPAASFGEAAPRDRPYGDGGDRRRRGSWTRPSSSVAPAAGSGPAKIAASRERLQAEKGEHTRATPCGEARENAVMGRPHHSASWGLSRK